MNKLARDLERLAAEYEYRAKTEADFDIELREEFFDYDGSDDEADEKANQKLDQYLSKKEAREKAKNRLKNWNQWGGIDHPDLEETVEQSIIERQQEQYNETINCSLGNCTVTKETTSDRYVTKQFLNRLSDKENTNPKDWSSETFVIEKPKLDETVIKDNPMHVYQNTMYAHAVNKLAARMRRLNPSLHQGSFSLDKTNSTLSEFDLTPSELPEGTFVSESFIYSEEEDDVTCVERDVEFAGDSASDTETSSEYTEATPNIPATYINIDNDTTYASGEPSLPVISFIDGRQVQVGTKPRKPTRAKPELRKSSEDSEVSFALAGLEINNRSSKRMSSTRLDYPQATPTNRNPLPFRPTFSAPQPFRTRTFRDSSRTTPRRDNINETQRLLDELMNSPSAKSHRQMRRLLESGYKKI